MIIIKFFFFLFFVVGTSFANRAFPMMTQEFVSDLFKTINPSIEWDPTNYLVDLSGPVTNCAILGQRGPFKVDKKLANGKTIGGLRDYHPGTKPYVEDVHEYLVAGLKSWITDNQMIPQIQKAERFGCSVRPLCSGYITFACLFSPSAYDPVPAKTTPYPGDRTAQPKAKAFTPEQYLFTENLLSQKWDRSYALENLSGLDTDCSMIHTNAAHTNGRNYAAQHNFNLHYVYGAAENKGETQPAMEIILKSLEATITKVNPREIGCSLIPDCMYQRKMFVVVNCILE